MSNPNSISNEKSIRNNFITVQKFSQYTKDQAKQPISRFTTARNNKPRLRKPLPITMTKVETHSLNEFLNKTDYDALLQIDEIENEFGLRESCKMIKNPNNMAWLIFELQQCLKNEHSVIFEELVSFSIQKKCATFFQEVMNELEKLEEA